MKLSRGPRRTVAKSDRRAKAIIYLRDPSEALDDPRYEAPPTDIQREACDRMAVVLQMDVVRVIHAAGGVLDIAASLEELVELVRHDRSLEMLIVYDLGVIAPDIDQAFDVGWLLGSTRTAIAYAQTMVRPWMRRAK